MKIRLMETLVITLKSDKARKLLQDLEELEILEVMDEFNRKKKICRNKNF